ncbi:hypothetical protein ASPCAL13179 [Aspergillus calidoustus]|uniref:Uncharacterized protein n=1 Tax=Aspergillus calidoustus TaxID=454130 RepID=A0A0U5H7J5_ASPCI|nr:hypothetical protein ASPCAL13179 [Aspergillus calidoustus]
MLLRSCPPFGQSERVSRAVAVKRPRAHIWTLGDCSYPVQLCDIIASCNNSCELLPAARHGGVGIARCKVAQPPGQLRFLNPSRPSATEALSLGANHTRRLQFVPVSGIVDRAARRIYVPLQEPPSC